MRCSIVGTATSMSALCSAISATRALGVEPASGDHLVAQVRADEVGTQASAVEDGRDDDHGPLAGERDSVDPSPPSPTAISWSRAAPFGNPVVPLVSTTIRPGLLGAGSGSVEFAATRSSIVCASAGDVGAIVHPGQHTRKLGGQRVEQVRGTRCRAGPPSRSPARRPARIGAWRSRCSSTPAERRACRRRHRDDEAAVVATQQTHDRACSDAQPFRPRANAVDPSSRPACRSVSARRRPPAAAYLRPPWIANSLIGIVQDCQPDVCRSLVPGPHDPPGCGPSAGWSRCRVLH